MVMKMLFSHQLPVTLLFNGLFVRRCRHYFQERKDKDVKTEVLRQTILGKRIDIIKKNFRLLIPVQVHMDLLASYLIPSTVPS